MSTKDEIAEIEEAILVEEWEIENLRELVEEMDDKRRRLQEALDDAEFEIGLYFRDITESEDKIDDLKHQLREAEERAIEEEE